MKMKTGSDVIEYLGTVSMKNTKAEILSVVSESITALEAMRAAHLERRNTRNAQSRVKTVVAEEAPVIKERSGVPAPTGRVDVSKLATWVVWPQVGEVEGADGLRFIGCDFVDGVTDQRVLPSRVLLEKLLVLYPGNQYFWRSMNKSYKAPTTKTFLNVLTRITKVRVEYWGGQWIRVTGNDDLAGTYALDFPWARKWLDRNSPSVDELARRFERCERITYGGGKPPVVEPTGGRDERDEQDELVEELRQLLF